MIKSNSLLITTSKSAFDDKLNGFLIGYDVISQHFQVNDSKYLSRDITYAQFLSTMERLDRRVKTYINDATLGKDNYAKKMIDNFASEHRKITLMLDAKEGLIIKSYKYTNEQISNEIIRCSKMKYDNLLAIRDYVRACDSIILTGIDQIYNIPEIENLSIEDASELLLNRLYRIRDNESFFPLKAILKGNGIVFKREGTYQFLSENLQGENYIDFKNLDNDYYIRISLSGIDKIEQQKKLVNNRPVLMKSLQEIKKSIPKNGIKISIERIKSLLIDTNAEVDDELWMIESRYYILKSEEIKGIISDELKILETNKITNSLIMFVTSIIEGKLIN